MTSTSEEVQTTTGTSACSAATAMRSAGSIFVVGSTWTVVFPMETVMVRAVALRHVVVLVVLEVLEALEALEPGVRLVVRMELRRRESGGEGGGGESGKRGGGSGGRGSDGDVELAGGTAGGAAGGSAGGSAGGGLRRPQCRPTLLLVALVATWTWIT